MHFNSLKFLIEDNNIDNVNKEDKPSVDDGLEKDAPATEPQIKQIKKILLSNINKFAKQKIKGSLDEDLGIFTLQNLNSISRIPILGKMFLNPMQTKGAQKKGTSSFDLMQYKKMQVIPFFLFNKDNENINAQNSKEDYNLLFLVPVVGAKISPDNLEQHKVLFSKETSNGFKLKDYYETLPNIGYIADIKLTNDELVKASSALKTDNISAIKLPINKKSTRKSTGTNNESIDIISQNTFINEEKNIFNMKKENYRKNIYMNDRIIKGKLSDLLFEENNITKTFLLKEFVDESEIEGDLIGILANKISEIESNICKETDNVESLTSEILDELKSKNNNKINDIIVVEEILRIINDHHLDTLKQKISGLLFADELNELQEKNFSCLILNMRKKLKDKKSSVESDFKTDPKSDSESGSGSGSESDSESESLLGLELNNSNKLVDLEKNLKENPGKVVQVNLEKGGSAATTFYNNKYFNLTVKNNKIDEHDVYDAFNDLSGDIYKYTIENNIRIDNITVLDDSYINKDLNEYMSRQDSGVKDDEESGLLANEKKVDPDSLFKSLNDSLTQNVSNVYVLKDSGGEFLLCYHDKKYYEITISNNDGDIFVNPKNTASYPSFKELKQRIINILSQEELKVSSFEKADDSITAAFEKYSKSLSKTQSKESGEESSVIKSGNLDPSSIRPLFQNVSKDYLQSDNADSIEQSAVIRANPSLFNYNQEKINAIDNALESQKDITEFVNVESIENFSSNFVDNSTLDIIAKSINFYKISAVKASALKDYVGLLSDRSNSAKSIFEVLRELVNDNSEIGEIVFQTIKDLKITNETSKDNCIDSINKEISRLNDINKKSGEVIESIVKNEKLMTALKNEKVTSGNIKTDIRGKIGNLYRGKFSPESIDAIFDMLKKSSNSSIKKIFDKNLDFFGESFVYKNGIKVLLEDNDSSETKASIDIKINIDDLFYALYDKIYNDVTVKKEIKGLDDDRTDFIYFKETLGMSRERYNDAKKQGFVDISLDIAKVFAYAICSAVLDNKERFKEKSIEVSGKLKELDEIRINSKGILYSETTYNRLKKENPGASTMSEEELNRMLDNSVKNIIRDICISQHSKYDEDLKKVVLPKIEKWRKSDEMSERDHLQIQRKIKRVPSSLGGAVAGTALGFFIGGPIGGAVVGALGGYLYGKDADEETFTSRREIWSKEPDVVESVDKLFNAIVGLAAKIKDVTLESLMINTSLTKLIFENILLENKEGLSYDDVKKYLSSQKILSFGFPEVINKGEAEASLTEAVCGILEDLFDIKISGVSDAQNSLALSRISAVLDEKAEAGQPVSEDLAIETSAAGVPQNLNANMTSMQLLNVLNQTSGDNFIKFIMLFMSQKDEMMKLFNEMDQGKVSGRQAAMQISKASGGEMSELENLLQTAIKTMRVSLPKIKLTQARKLILTLKNKENQEKIKSLLEGSDDIDNIKFNEKIEKIITDNFNITEDEHDDVHNLSLKLVDSSLINVTLTNEISVIPGEFNLSLELILKGIITSRKVTLDDVKVENKENIKDTLNTIIGTVNNVLTSMKIIVKENKQNSDLFTGSLANYLFEGSKRVSTQKHKTSYNNPKFLELELKRIWKL